MDRVFPENMNPVNAADPQAAISTIDAYLRYMRERIEYAIGIITKLNGGTSVADLAERLLGAERDIGLIYQDLDEQGTGIGYRVLMLEQQVGNIASVLAQI